MTEPARPPGGDPGQPGAPEGGPSQWARPDQGAGSPSEASPRGYAPPPAVSPPPGHATPPPGYATSPAPGYAGSPASGYATSPPGHAGASPPPGRNAGPLPPPPGHPAPWGPVGGPAGWGGSGPVATPPPPQERPRPPKRVEAVPGTPFGVVHLDVPPVTSGLAVGSLVAGVVSILVGLLVVCVGAVAGSGGGAWAAVAFALLGLLTGAGAVVAGLLGMRQIRRPAAPPAVRFTGRGLAVAGLSCGGTGLVLSLVGLVLGVLLSLV